MRPSPAPASGSSHYVWRVDDKPVAVHLSLDVVSRMQSLLSLTPGERTPEVGGLLLGQLRQVNDSWIVSIDDFEAAECEYVRGASWTLSARDRQNFGRRLERLRSRGPIGWFRTHTRPGLFLDQSDFRLFSDFFHHPASVALAIRPQAAHGAEAGFFFWEDGDVRRSSPYSTFPFSAEALSSAAPLVPAPEASVPEPAKAAKPKARPVRPAARQQPTTQPASHLPSSAAPAKVASSAAPSPAPAARVAATTGLRSLWSRRKLAYATPIVIGILAGFLWHPTVLRNSRSRAAQPPSPKTADVATERAVFAPPPDAAPLQQPENQPPVAEPVSAPVTPRQVPVRQATQSVKRLAVSAVSQPRSLPEPKIDDRPPEIAMSMRTEPPPMAPPAQPRITATVEQVKVSGLRRAVGSIPGLGFLKRRKNAEAFVPPKPIQRIEPASLALAREDEPVRVKVTVDPTGEVASAQVLSRNIEPDVARAAVEAARKWRFAPATVDDKPVSAELILSFAAATHRGL